MASWSVQPFLQGSLQWQTDRQTDWPIDHAGRSVTIGRIYVHTTASLQCGIKSELHFFCNNTDIIIIIIIIVQALLLCLLQTKHSCLPKVNRKGYNYNWKTKFYRRSFAEWVLQMNIKSNRWMSKARLNNEFLAIFYTLHGLSWSICCLVVLST